AGGGHGLVSWERTGGECLAHARRLRLDDDVVVLDRHRKGFGLVGPLPQLGPRLDRLRVLTRAQPLRVAPGAAGANVELPGMPGATDDLALPGIAVIARLRRFEEAGEPAMGEASALVRAAVVEGEELAVDVEDDDRPVADRHELATAGGNFTYRRDHVPGHQASL